MFLITLSFASQQCLHTRVWDGHWVQPKEMLSKAETQRDTELLLHEVAASTIALGFHPGNSLQICKCCHGLLTTLTQCQT